MTPETIEKIVADHAGEQGALLSILEDIQEKFHYLPEDALKQVSRRTGRSLTDIYGVATFYKAFSLKPKGKHVISVCRGTACHVRSAPGIVDEFTRQIGLKPGDTSQDKELTLETVNCLGTCALGPIVAVDGRYFSNVGRKDVKKILRATKAGFAEAAPDKNGNGHFPTEVVCPHCSAPLMTAEGTGNEACLTLEVSFNGRRTRARITDLFGPLLRSSELGIAPDTTVTYSCPACQAQLAGRMLCEECGAPMAPLLLGVGGELLICSRWGCANSAMHLNVQGGRANQDMKMS